MFDIIILLMKIHKLEKLLLYNNVRYYNLVDKNYIYVLVKL